MGQQTWHGDVLVIGGGVVGCSILRELTRFDLSVALIEARSDVCDATSKANSGIVHTGFDAPPGSLEALLMAESRGLWTMLADELGFPYRQTGALLVAISDEEWRVIQEEIAVKARKNGVRLESVARDDLRAIAPYLTRAAVGAMLVQGEGVCDPFRHTVALCESAADNGAGVFLEQQVVSLEMDGSRIIARTVQGQAFSAAAVVNAAGLWSDDVARMAGDSSFSITPRKGQFLITDEQYGVDHIILPVPNAITKGVLVTPTLYGGALMGPTAEDQHDKTDTSTNQEGLRTVREGAAKLVPVMAQTPAVREYAGVRAVSSTGEYIIGPSSTSNRLFHAAGIRSTGLSASPGIGRYVAGMVAGRLGARPNGSFRARPASKTPASSPGDVVCLCMGTTRADVIGALHRVPAPTTLDALRRRTGAMLGECQGNLCMPGLLDMMAGAFGRQVTEIRKDADGSQPIVVAVHATAGRDL